MKKLLGILFAFACITAKSQDVNVMMKEASNLEIKLDEAGALGKYKQVYLLDTNNVAALVKSSELSSRIGNRQKDNNAKSDLYNQAQSYAMKALSKDSVNAEAAYALSLASQNLAGVSNDNKQKVAYTFQAKNYADKALAADPSNAKANFAAGNWHYQMLTIPGLKKTAAKVLYGKLPEADIDSAIYYMEKSRSLDPYFALDYLQLGKAYEFKGQPAKAIEVYTKLVKLPNRTADDAVLKEEGKKSLDRML